MYFVIFLPYFSRRGGRGGLVSMSLVLKHILVMLSHSTPVLCDSICDGYVLRWNLDGREFVSRFNVRLWYYKSRNISKINYSYSIR